MIYYLIMGLIGIGALSLVIAIIILLVKVILSIFKRK